MMKNLIKSLSFIIAVILFAACGAEKTPRLIALDEIKKSEAAMHQNINLNDSIATAAIVAYEKFVNQFPTDVLCPDFLFKSAEIATASKQYEKALVLYNQITFKYPSYVLIQESYFLKASLLDNYIQRDGEAKHAYEELIEKFPKSNYISDAKAAIANLGLSDQELIQAFEKKNSQ